MKAKLEILATAKERAKAKGYPDIDDMELDVSTPEKVQEAIEYINGLPMI
jgi:hypothetical protein